MSIINGMKVICSRCGTEAFITDHRDILYQYGAGKGWTSISERHHLCPHCSIPFKRYMTWFFEKGQCPNAWRFKQGEDV